MPNKEEIKQKEEEFSVEELLQSDKFISSCLNPDAESDKYYDELVKREALDERDFRFARRFIRSAQCRPEHLPQGEKFELWASIEVANKKNLKAKQRRLYIISLASAAAALLLPAFWGMNRLFSEAMPAGLSHMSMEEVAFPERTTDVQLFLDNGRVVSLGGNDVKIAYRGENIYINDSAVVLKNAGMDAGNGGFHQMLVPWGKRSVLLMNDGSRLWANAGTRIVYPATFSADVREVYVDGEVYVEAAHDDTQPFAVKTKSFAVEVTGTQFNLMAYEQDSMKSIVLVSGSVKVHDAHLGETILKPRQMYLSSGGHAHVEAVNVENHISWKSGVYLCNGEPLGRIAERLAHYYGQSIACSPQAAVLRFSGKLDLQDRLENILDGITRAAPVTCRINNGTYIINMQ
ncbi:MAG: FecR domain-containing protein [Tannerellaceae bacterium]|jgi:hypothetical protein|nr:FecR domain-containing protein [Tannerellaceae bacterium]